MRAHSKADAWRMSQLHQYHRDNIVTHAQHLLHPVTISSTLPSALSLINARQRLTREERGKIWEKKYDCVSGNESVVIAQLLHAPGLMTLEMTFRNLGVIFKRSIFPINRKGLMKWMVRNSQEYERVNLRKRNRLSQQFSNNDHSSLRSIHNASISWTKIRENFSTTGNKTRFSTPHFQARTLPEKLLSCSPFSIVFVPPHHYFCTTRKAQIFRALALDETCPGGFRS